MTSDGLSCGTVGEGYVWCTCGWIEPATEGEHAAGERWAEHAHSAHADELPPEGST